MNYLYNGIPLPNVNEVWTDDLKAEYPNAAITLASGIYYFSYYSTTPTANQHGVIQGANGRTYQATSGESTWTKSSVATALTPRTPIWSNYDIYYADDVEEVGGTLYLAASDPIPLDGMQVIEWDGDTEGLPSNVDGNMFRVSPFVSLENGTEVIIRITNGTAYDTGSISVSAPTDGMWNVTMDGTELVGASKYTVSADGITLTDGIYFYHSDEMWVDLLAYTPATSVDPEDPEDQEKEESEMYVSKMNGYSIKDKEARELLESLKVLAGYGLGTAKVIQYSEIDSIVENGWYKFDVHESPITINNHGISYGRLFVIAYGEGTVTQILYDGSALGVVFQRIKSGGTWGTWGSFNPRMAENTEHKTSELHGDKPIYTKLIHCGTVANGMSINAGSNITIVRQAGRLNDCPIPYSATGDGWHAYNATTGGTIYLYCSDNFCDGNYHWFHQIWYYYK